MPSINRDVFKGVEERYCNFELEEEINKGAKNFCIVMQLADHKRSPKDQEPTKLPSSQRRSITEVSRLPFPFRAFHVAVAQERALTSKDPLSVGVVET